jgi:nucleoside-diphosphate-sugar epimerase
LKGLAVAGISVPEGLARLTEKLRMTGVAALKPALPAWLAVIVHVPALSSVTRLLAVVQTAEVPEVNVTGRRELACAAIANGDVPRILAGTASKVMVCAV